MVCQLVNLFLYCVYCNLMVRRAHDVLCKDPSPVWAIIIFCHNIRTTNLGNALVHVVRFWIFGEILSEKT